eukprot:CAMPEP_0194491090 /NCGR_PEP_ID=MMETSP0253-20130528/10085_1 /TAXON_ID=2966 /ORGANISM="Noctiluca scintillans" /LENGTH=53 /DNA_ID=CAMNT_0039331783 /DNA_START=357 /DNA_END=515 /DNA_ORIENTATION=+
MLWLPEAELLETRADASGSVPAVCKLTALLEGELSERKHRDTTRPNTSPTRSA